MDPSLGLDGRGHATNVMAAITATATAAPPNASNRHDVYRLRLVKPAARIPSVVMAPSPATLCTLDRAIRANHNIYHCPSYTQVIYSVACLKPCRC